MAPRIHAPVLVGPDRIGNDFLVALGGSVRIFGPDRRAAARDRKEAQYRDRVGQVSVRVTPRFEDHHGVRCEGGIPCLQIIAIDQRMGDAKARQNGCYDLIAGTEQGLGWLKKWL